MSVRSRMTHRAHVTRAVVADPFDTFNNPLPSETNVYSESPITLYWGDHPIHWGNHPLEWGSGVSGLLPCYVQSSMERRITEEGRYYAVATHLMLAPIGSDLREDDRVTSVTNRRGTAIFTSRLRVATLIRRETHLEATLEQFG